MTYPGPNGGNIHTGDNSVPNAGQQDPGLHGNSYDPGPSSHPLHNVSARPVFYIHAPPPPPFLHYQWSMPFSYNPFAGFPGMGYGMVMPPFPPPPYMESPAYFMPHPPIQAVDYRRLLHPQVHAPSAPHQNPNQTRRVRPSHTVPLVRETVNSEVQTEPTHRGIGGYGGGSLLTSSESGHGTASGSPCSSSSSQKRGSAEVENYTLPSGTAEDFKVNSTSSEVKHSFNIPHPTGVEMVQSCIKATPEKQNSCKASIGHVNGHPCINGHCNMWSVSSPDSTVLVCSSSKQDEVVEERQVSIPDILMSWGGGTPQATILKMADKVLPQNDHKLLSSKTELEHKSVYQSPINTQNDPVMADSTDDDDDDAESILSSKDSEILFKILKLPLAHYNLLLDSRGDNEPVESVGSVRQCLPHRDELLHSLKKSYKLPDDEQNYDSETNIHEDTLEIVPYQMSFNSCHMKRNMNESDWSVESLAPFIPTKEWLLQNGMFEPEVIAEMTEEAENGGHSTQNDNLIFKPSKRRHACLFSSSDSIPMSDSWHIFSSPAEKLSPPQKPECQVSEIKVPRQDQNMDPLPTLTCLQSRIIVSPPPAECICENGSSEQGATRNLNQESLTENVQQRSSCSPEQEATLLLNSATGEKIFSTGNLIVHYRVDTEAEDGACGNKEISQLRNEQLCVPMANEKRSEVSPSKGHLVDCGIQCTEFQEPKCSCEELRGGVVPNNRKHSLKYSDMKKVNNGNAEGFYMKGNVQKNQRRHGQWRNRGSEKHSSQQKAYIGYPGKPGKSKGGNGKNSQS